MKNYSISVFLPAYNEEENIKTCILSIQEYLNEKFKNYEILVINGKSTDNTEKIVKNLIKKNKRIKLISQKKDFGYGAALRAGFENSTKDLVFYTDSDNQFDIKDLDNLLPLIESCDIVSGYRIKRKDPLTRIFTAIVYNILIKVMFNLKIKDIDSSFKLYKKKIFKKITLKSNTGLVDAEVMIKAKKYGFSIGQIGVSHYPRTKGRTVYEISRINNIIAVVHPRVVLDIFKEIKNLWPELR